MIKESMILNHAKSKRRCVVTKILLNECEWVKFVVIDCTKEKWLTCIIRWIGSWGSDPGIVLSLSDNVVQYLFFYLSEVFFSSEETKLKGKVPKVNQGSETYSETDGRKIRMMKRKMNEGPSQARILLDFFPFWFIIFSSNRIFFKRLETKSS